MNRVACFAFVLVGVLAPELAATEQVGLESNSAWALSDSDARVTFAGFQHLSDGVSRVFVRLTAKPDLDVSRPNDSKIVYTLRATNVGVRNNRNPLELRYFNTRVRRAQLVVVGSDVELVVSFKGEASAQHRFVERADGSVTLQVDVPRAD